MLRIHKTHVKSRRITIDQSLQGGDGMTMIPRHPDLEWIIHIDL
jgi:hypothetical protein